MGSRLENEAHPAAAADRHSRVFPAGGGEVRAEKVNKTGK